MRRWTLGLFAAGLLLQVSGGPATSQEGPQPATGEAVGGGVRCAPWQRALLGKLSRSISAGYSEAPLRDVAETLSSTLDIPVRLDRLGLDDAGLSADTPITIAFSETSVENLLWHVCRGHGLALTFGKGALVFTSPDRAASQPLTWVYPNRAPQFLANEVASGVGVGGGGFGGMGGGGLGGGGLESGGGGMFRMAPGQAGGEGMMGGGGMGGMMGGGGMGGGEFSAGVAEEVSLADLVTPDDWVEVGGFARASSLGRRMVVSHSLAGHRELQRLMEVLDRAQRLPRQAQPEFLVCGGRATRKIWSELPDRRLSVDVVEIALSEVAQMLSGRLDTHVLLDVIALEEAGCDLDTPVTVRCQNQQLRHVLDAICEPLELTWTVAHGALLITSEDAIETHDTRLYPVADLLGDPVSLRKLITEHVEPDSWIESGGAGAINVHRPTGMLLVRQSNSVHWGIVDLLRNLRGDSAAAEAPEKRPSSNNADIPKIRRGKKQTRKVKDDPFGGDPFGQSQAPANPFGAGAKASKTEKANPFGSGAGGDAGDASPFGAGAGSSQNSANPFGSPGAGGDAGDASPFGAGAGSSPNSANPFGSLGAGGDAGDASPFGR